MIPKNRVVSNLISQVSIVDNPDPFGDESGLVLYQFDSDNNDSNNNLNLPVGGTYVVGEYGNGNNGSSAFTSASNPTGFSPTAPYSFKAVFKTSATSTVQLFLLNDWAGMVQFDGTVNKYYIQWFDGVWNTLYSDVVVLDNIFSTVVLGYNGSKFFISVNNETKKYSALKTPNVYLSKFGVSVVYDANTIIDQARLFNKEVTQDEIVILNDEGI